jgi:bla regulator protein blaR1
MTEWLMPAFVNHLWQSTLFVAVVWLATLALRRNRARVRYWLWAAASVKFLIPLSVLVSVGALVEWRAAPVSVQPAVLFVMEEVLAPAAVVAIAAPASTSEPLFVPWLLAAWVAGTVCVLASWWRHWRPIRSALQQATPVRLDPQCDAGDLVIMSTPSRLEPGVVGIVRPVLLLPHGIVGRLTAAQLRALVTHERCHIRCRDNLVAATQMMVEAFVWFHPLVWWIGRRMIDERERACDEAVLRSGSRPRDYAEGILEVCRLSVASPLACVAGVSGSDLRRRVESIMRREIGQPMTVVRRWALAAATVVAVAGPMAAGGMTAQSVGQLPHNVAPQLASDGVVRFEVASVRANGSGELGMRLMGARGRTYTATNVAIRYVVAAAYQVPVTRVLGGPAWIGAAGVDMRFTGGERFDISATLPEGAAVNQVPAMLRALLADRFKLTARREMREAPMYALVLARGDGRTGPRLRKASLDCEAAEAAGEAIPPPKPGERGLCDSEIGGEIVGRGRRLGALARMLSLFAGREVVDRTGLTGGFDFDLRFAELDTPTDGRGGGPGVDGGGGIFVALQEQLGLRLESIRAPLEFVVIDSVERPTEN